MSKRYDEIKEEKKLALVGMYTEEDCREYVKRCKESATFREMSEDDREVFRCIDKDVVALEEQEKTTYCYLTEQAYWDIKRYAGFRLTPNSIRIRLGWWATKWKKMMRKYPKLEERIRDWGDNLLATAVEIIAEDVQKNKNVDNAKWLAERLDRQTFGKGLNVNVSGGVLHTQKLDVEQLKKLRDDLGSVKRLNSDNNGANSAVDGDFEIVDSE